jgi:hypothetical protein
MSVENTCTRAALVWYVCSCPLSDGQPLDHALEFAHNVIVHRCLEALAAEFSPESEVALETLLYDLLVFRS